MSLDQGTVSNQAVSPNETANVNVTSPHTSIYKEANYRQTNYVHVGNTAIPHLDEDMLSAPLMNNTNNVYSVIPSHDTGPLSFDVLSPLQTDNSAMTLALLQQQQQQQQHLSSSQNPFVVAAAAQLEQEYYQTRAMLPHCPRHVLLSVLISLLDDFPTTMTSTIRVRAEQAMLISRGANPPLSPASSLARTPNVRRNSNFVPSSNATPWTPSSQPSPQMCNNNNNNSNNNNNGLMISSSSSSATNAAAVGVNNTTIPSPSATNTTNTNTNNNSTDVMNNALSLLPNSNTTLAANGFANGFVVHPSTFSGNMASAMNTNTINSNINSISTTSINNGGSSTTISNSAMGGANHPTMNIAAALAAAAQISSGVNSPYAISPTYRKGGITSNSNNSNNNNVNSSSSNSNLMANANSMNVNNRTGHKGRDEETEMCSIHHSQRAIKHLKINPVTGQFECIPGFHCLVDEPVSNVTSPASKTNNDNLTTNTTNTSSNNTTLSPPINITVPNGANSINVHDNITSNSANLIPMMNGMTLASTNSNLGVAPLGVMANNGQGMVETHIGNSNDDNASSKMMSVTFARSSLSGETGLSTSDHTIAQLHNLSEGNGVSSTSSKQLFANNDNNKSNSNNNVTIAGMESKTDMITNSTLHFDPTCQSSLQKIPELQRSPREFTENISLTHSGYSQPFNFKFDLENFDANEADFTPEDDDFKLDITALQEILQSVHNQDWDDGFDTSE